MIMKKFNGLMTSLSPNYKTPEWLFLELNKEFKFDFDPCPLNERPKIDGLSIEWGGVNFVNPPYGRKIGEWIKKGVEQFQKGKVVVFLIPSRTDTKWWHDYIMYASEIRYIKGRLKFGNCKNSAPFPSCIVIFK
jgi:site-specific DNA-methyltransferase (adenine-specific)